MVPLMVILSSFCLWPMMDLDELASLSGGKELRCECSKVLTKESTN